MLRRGLALGGGLILLILVVLGIKGCLDARANRELSDYARNVTQIAEETEQTSKSFFGRLEDPGGISVTDFVDQVNADRSAMDGYASRVDGLGAPGDMGDAQDTLKLVYDLRSSAMNEIADKMSTALADEGAKKATAVISRQMQKLLAGDVLYETIVRPEIDGVLADNGISGSDVPPSSFLPEGTEWLEEETISAALGEVNGSESGGGDPSLIHGLGLAGASINGSELVEGGAVSVTVEETPEVEVLVENQGESTESGVTVSISIDGGKAIEQDISSIGAGELESVTIPLTPTPSGEKTLEVKVDTVPGETVSTNNEASYVVVFE
jgi:hypothetical protein